MTEGQSVAFAQRLTGEMTTEAFEAEIREREARRFSATIDAAAIAQMLDIAGLEQLLVNDLIPASHIDVIAGGLPCRLTDLMRGRSKSALIPVANYLGRGASIRVTDIQYFHKGLEHFSLAVAARFTARAQINLYLTPAGNAGFDPHFDSTDSFIVQCAGSKAWKIFADYTNRLDLPLLYTPWISDRYRPFARFASFTLNVGDVLYLPRGFLHQALCLDEPSMHLTISVAPITLADVLFREVKRIAECDVSLRERIIWSVTDTAAERRQLAEHIHAQFARVLDRADVGAALAEEQRALREIEPTTMCSDLLASALARARTYSEG